MSKKINISIVGTGLMGLQHIKAISKSKKANQHTKNIRIDVNDVSSFTNKNDTSVPSNNKVNDNNKWNWICTLLWNKKSPTITPETQQNINNTKEQNKS